MLALQRCKNRRLLTGAMLLTPTCAPTTILNVAARQGGCFNHAVVDGASYRMSGGMDNNKNKECFKYGTHQRTAITHVKSHGLPIKPKAAE